MKKLLLGLICLSYLPLYGFTHTINNRTDNTLQVTAELDGTSSRTITVDPNTEKTLLIVDLWPTEMIKIKATDGPQKGKTKDKGIVKDKQSKGYIVNVTYDAATDAFVVKLL